MAHPAVALVAGDPYAIALSDVELPPLKPGEATVAIAYAALNRRDEWMRQGQYPGIVEDTVLGSDGAGRVVAVGQGVDTSWQDKQVLINPNVGWGTDEAAQRTDYTILGMPQNGTLQALLNIPAHRLHVIPQHLSLQQAAALPLAGMTAYRATIVKGQAGPGKRVLVTGIGGGVAQLAAQLALAAGAEVYVSSGEEDKLAHFNELGVAGTVNYKTNGWARDLAKATGGMHSIIDSAMGPTANDLINLVHPGGVIVFYGATLGRPEALNVHKLFWKQARLEGSTMGSDNDFAAMLAFVAQHKIAPIIDQVFPLAEAEAAFDRLKAGGQFGKVVLKIAED